MSKSKVIDKQYAFLDGAGVPQKDQYGNVSFNIKFENGDEGLWATKPDNADYFKIGEEQEYEITDKTSASGKAYKKITRPQKDFQKGGGAKYTPKKKVAYKADMVSFGFSYAKDLMIADKLPEGTKLGEMGPMLVKAMWKMIDEIEGLE